MSQVAPKQLSSASASDGQVLTYDSSTSTWGPESVSGGGGGGETNTASNLGTTTYGLFGQKSSSDLQFKSLTAGSNITLTASGTEVQIAAAGGAATEISALVRTASGLSVANNTDTLVTGFGSAIDFNNGPLFSISNTDRLTIPSGEGGRYCAFVWTSYPSTTAGSVRDVKIQVNGSNQRWFRQHVPGGTSTYVAASFAPLNVSAADYVTVILRQNAGTTLYTNDQTLFGLWKIQ